MDANLVWRSKSTHVLIIFLLIGKVIYENMIPLNDYLNLVWNLENNLSTNMAHKEYLLEILVPMKLKQFTPMIHTC